VAFLSKVSLFRDWTPEQLGALQPLMVVESVTHGTPLCVEGKMTSSLIILRSGRVHVSKRTTHDPLRLEVGTKWQDGGRRRDHGVDIHLASLGDGEVFGELSMFADLNAEENVTIDSSVAQLWRLSKVDCSRKFDATQQENIVRMAKQKKQFRFSRLEQIVKTMLRQNKTNKVKQRGPILVPFPAARDLVSIAHAKPKPRRHLSRQTTAPAVGSPAWASRSFKSTKSRPSSRAKVSVEVESSSFFLTAPPPVSDLDDRPLHLSTWTAPGQHSVNLSDRLSALMLDTMKVPHVELDIDQINDLDLDL